MSRVSLFRFGTSLAAATLLLACTSNGPGTGAGGNPGGTPGGTGGNQAACTASISNGASVATHKTGLCLLCSVSNPNNVIDSDPNNYASINLDLSLLTAGVGLSVNGPSGVTYPAGQIPGFTLFVPNPLLLSATVLPQIKITTFLGGTQQESSTFSQLLTLDLLGLLSNNNPFYLGIKTTKSFDAVDITVAPIVAGALATLNVVNACSDGTGVGVFSPLPTP
ncbi:MAG: hypothetical protein IRZ06_08815 [Nevskia sp.]|nr:hypothetical protein [Nevskia sp.]